MIYRLPKPRPDGQTVLYLTPLEFLDRLAALVPPPRAHRHRYHGVLAPNAPLRPAVTAYAGLPMETAAGQPASPIPPVQPDAVTAGRLSTSPARYLWAVLIARIYAILPLICPECGGAMRLIACVTEPEPGEAPRRRLGQRILLHIGEPATPPPTSPARSPPLAEAFDWDQSSANDPEKGEPAPEFEFDQTVNW